MKLTIHVRERISRGTAGNNWLGQYEIKSGVFREHGFRVSREFTIQGANLQDALHHLRARLRVSLVEDIENTFEVSIYPRSWHFEFESNIEVLRQDYKPPERFAAVASCPED